MSIPDADLRIVGFSAGRHIRVFRITHLPTGIAIDVDSDRGETLAKAVAELERLIKPLSPAALMGDET